MKNIPFNEKYSITEDGRVFNNKRKKEKKSFIDKHGYCRIGLDKQNKKYFIHRLVAITYIKNLENKETVNHKDGNKLNNHVDNLEWMNNSENLNHAFNNNLIKRRPIKCKKTGKVWESLNQAAKENNINPGHLYNMLKGITKNTKNLIYLDDTPNENNT